MSRYEDLDLNEGQKFMPSVWNLFFKPLEDEDFFVEPWRNTEIRDCAEFSFPHQNGACSCEVLFFAQDQEMIDFLNSNAEQELYMFGAYNQINVAQMRAKGVASRVEDFSPVEVLNMQLLRAAEIGSRLSGMVGKLDKDEVQLRFKILAEGKLFRFSAQSFAHSGYERG